MMYNENKKKYEFIRLGGSGGGGGVRSEREEKKGCVRREGQRCRVT